jgi:hypothetical protein
MRDCLFADVLRDRQTLLKVRVALHCVLYPLVRDCFVP